MKRAIFEIAGHYGYDTQSRQLVEEMAELTQAINKFWRNQQACGKIEYEDVPLNTQEEKNIIEELADVELLIDQMKLILMCREDVNEIKQQKIKRQLQRIQAESTC